MFTGDGVDAYRFGNYTATTSARVTSNPSALSTAHAGSRTSPLAAIIGGTIGGLVFTVVLIILLWYKRRSKRRLSNLHHSEESASRKSAHYTPVIDADSTRHDEQPQASTLDTIESALFEGSGITSVHPGHAEQASPSLSKTNNSRYEIISVVQSIEASTKAISYTEQPVSVDGWPWNSERL